MDLVSILNKMDPQSADTFFNLPPEIREKVYTTGIVLTILENEFNNNKSKRDNIIFYVRNDPDLFNIKNITSPKILLKAAKNKILEMKTIEEVRAYIEYLGLTENLDYAIYDADQVAQSSAKTLTI